MKKSSHTCPCGHHGYRLTEECSKCLKEKGAFVSSGTNRHKWTPDKVSILKLYYPTEGADGVSARLNNEFSLDTIRNRASRLKIKLTSESYKKRVHDAAGKFMRENNPAKTEAGRERSRALMKSIPMRLKQVNSNAKLCRANPRNTELFAQYAIQYLKCDYEFQYVVHVDGVTTNPYIVDFLIRGKLVLEIDGEWWHGHPDRFTGCERQVKQLEHDKKRDNEIAQCGFDVVRIWERDFSINKLAEVLKSHKVIS